MTNEESTLPAAAAEPDAFAPGEAFGPLPDGKVYELLNRDGMRHTPSIDDMKAADRMYRDAGIGQEMASLLWDGQQSAKVNGRMSMFDPVAVLERLTGPDGGRLGAAGAKALLEAAQRDVQRIDAVNPAYADMLCSTGLGDDPRVILYHGQRGQAFEARGAKTPAASGTLGNKPTSDATQTAATAQAKLDELRGDPAWVKRYLDGGAAEGAEVDRLNRLVVGGV